MSTGIYKITNKINGKIYIGQSKNVERRWREHLRSKDNTPIHCALRKYGPENFNFEILAECDKDELNRLEQFYIQEYDCMSPRGYNLTPGGKCYRVKKESPEERKLIISITIEFRQAG